MRRIAAIALVAAAFPSAAWSTDIAAISRIEAVTVFADRAQVTRVARLDLPAGAHAVVFEGLPGQLLGDSLRVEGGGTTAVAIGSVDARPVTGEQPVGDKERELVRKLTDLRDKRALLDADLKALEVRQTFIEAIGKMAPDGAGKDLKKEMQPERWQQAWSTLETGAGETYRGIVLKQVERRALDESIRKVEDDLKRLQTGRRDSLTVRVNLESAAPAKLTLALRYQVPEAGWRPQYEARLDTAAGRITLVQQGVVRQRTGEDWSDVELILSTARPGLGTRPPDLQTWWIDYFEPRPLAAAPEARVLMKQEPRAAATQQEQDVPAGLVEADTVAGEFAAEYRIPGRSSVTADSSERRVAIATHQMAARMAVRAVPRIDAAAYLTAEATFAGAAPLLPGAMLLFRDGAFIGNARLDMLRPDETARLSFGIDDKVRIRHSLLTGQTSQQGILNRDRRVERKYRTIVENLHRQPIRVAILDNLPVSRQDTIHVDLLADATTPGFTRDFDGRTGVLVWEADYQPGEKRNIDLGYAVSFPRDRQVPGF